MALSRYLYKEGAVAALPWKTELIDRVLRILTVRQFQTLFFTLLNVNGFGWTSIDSEVRSFSAFLRKKEISEGFVLDIGASYGAWTKRFLLEEHSFQVVLFEPSSTPYEKICQDFAGNHNVSIKQLALGATSGARHLCSDEPGSGSASIVNRSFDNHQFCEAVKTMPLISVVQQYTDVVAIKLDCEGAEWEILSNFRLSKSKIQLIQFEFGEYMVENQIFFKDYYDYFLKNGFDLFRNTKRGPVKINQYNKWDEILVNCVYFAIRR